MNGRTNRRLGQLLLYIPEVVRVLVQLKAVPIVDRLLVQLNMLQLNSLALRAAKTGLTILEISNLQKHILKKHLKEKC